MQAAGLFCLKIIQSLVRSETTCVYEVEQNGFLDLVKENTSVLLHDGLGGKTTCHAKVHPSSPFMPLHLWFAFSAKCEDATVFVIESSTWGELPWHNLKDCFQELTSVIVSSGNTTTAIARDKSQ